MTSEIRTLAVVGHPIAHSLSPTLHQAAYEHLGLPWNYVAVDVQPGELAGFLDSTDSSLRGLSVTMPHKVAALESSKRLDLLSERTGSVNTLLCEYNESGDRELSGYNTDVLGIVNALKDSGVQQRQEF